MKKTILTAQQSQLLERLLLSYGTVVTTQQIYSQAQDFENDQRVKRAVASLVRNGWLIRIKRGVYGISDLCGRGFSSLSPYVVAHILAKDAYVSFESALSYHGLFDQLTDKIISISLSQQAQAHLQNMQYVFIKTQRRYFFGWQEVQLDNQLACIATPEKALVDTIQFRRSAYAIDLVREKLQEYPDDFDLEKLTRYISRMSTMTVKIFGLLFDVLNLDSTALYSLVTKTSTTHGTVTDLTNFSIKWRLYYDRSLTAAQSLTTII